MPSIGTNELYSPTTVHSFSFNIRRLLSTDSLVLTVNTTESSPLTLISILVTVMFTFATSIIRTSLTSEEVETPSKSAS